MRASAILTLTLLAAATLTAWPVAASAHGTAVSVVGEVRPNGPIEVQGEDFTPQDVVRLELRRQGVSPIELGKVPVDSDGTFSETFHVPVTVLPGIYELAADGQESATTEVTVLEAASGTEGLPTPQPSESVSNDRPTGEAVGLALMTAMFALAGVGFLVLSKTRPHRSAS